MAFVVDPKTKKTLWLSKAAHAAHLAHQKAQKEMHDKEAARATAHLKGEEKYSG